MGRGAGEAAPKIGEGAETFYDTQAFQYGVRDKWGYSFYHPNEDRGHKIFPKKLETTFFIKPWEQNLDDSLSLMHLSKGTRNHGGHPHDFLKATRSARSNDPYIHYERGKALERHERLVAEVVAWRRRELLKEEMIIQMSKLQAVERQRIHFQELRRQIHLEQLAWSRPLTARSAASSTQPSRAASCDEEHPHRPGSVNLSTQANSLRGSRRCSRQSVGGNSTGHSSARSSKASDMPPIRILNHSSGKVELQDLDTFEERLSLLVGGAAPPTSIKKLKQ